MTKQAVLDLYFAEARSKLIDLAAFLDRIERAGGEGDFRLESFLAGLREIAAGDGPDHARQLLTLLSDPTTEPVPAASVKSAAGAWPGFNHPPIAASPSRCDPPSGNPRRTRGR